MPRMAPTFALSGSTMSDLLLDVQAFGAIGVKTIDDEGRAHRRVVEPGRWESGKFVPNDLKGEPEEIIEFAAKTWTSEIVASWEAFLAEENKPAPVVIPDRVSARQFKLQLLAEGLLEQVDGWVASQGKAIQLAYDNSNEFDRDEPMMQSGFRALGFPPEQIDAFFSAASKR